MALEPKTTTAPAEADVPALAEDTMYGKYLVFWLENQEYAVAIRYVVDIINIQPYTRVPNCPDYVLGITNLRGKVIPIVDVRLRFGKEQQEYHDRTCIIVVELDEVSVGLIVDSVSEVIYLPDEAIAPPPQVHTSTADRFIENIGKAESGIKLILDCRAIVGDEEDPAAAEEVV